MAETKSYTLPKQLNEFCDKLKKEKELNKHLEIFKDRLWSDCRRN